MNNIEILQKKVSEYFKWKYSINLKDLDITDTPGYWRDKETKMHPGHPLHGCMFCDGPFKATYTYYDNFRGLDGKYQSRTSTWRKIYNTTIHGAVDRGEGERMRINTTTKAPYRDDLCKKCGANEKVIAVPSDLCERCFQRYLKALDKLSTPHKHIDIHRAVKNRTRSTYDA
jgi:hypothetical protein